MKNTRLFGLLAVVLLLVATPGELLSKKKGMKRWINAEGVTWYNPQKQDFLIVRGQGWPEELKGTYNRFPERSKVYLRDQLWGLSHCSTGLSIVFRTDASAIRVRFSVSEPYEMSHMPATGVSGVDLYSIDDNGHARWYATGHKRDFDKTCNYLYPNITYPEGTKNGFEYHLYLPLYNHIKWLEVGVDSSAHFEFCPITDEKPIVIYGTSIVQGACASRPAMAWPTIVERDMNCNLINLGFSGNAQMEPEVFDLLSEIDAEIFVIDCMQNMDSKRAKYIYERTVNGIHKLRKKTDAPILLVEHAGYANAETSDTLMHQYTECNVELSRAYRDLIEEGVQGLYLLPHEEIECRMDDMVEGWHPNDIGMAFTAAVTERYIRHILGK